MVRKLWVQESGTNLLSEEVFVGILWNPQLLDSLSSSSLSSVLPPHPLSTPLTLIGIKTVLYTTCLVGLGGSALVSWFGVGVRC